MSCANSLPTIAYDTTSHGSASSLSLSPHFIASERGGVESSKEEGGRDERGREGRTIIDGAVKSERRA